MKYDLVVCYKGFNPKKDAKIEKVVGRRGSSGFCLLTGVRELFFNFSHKQALLKACDRVEENKLKAIIWTNDDGQVKKFSINKFKKLMR